MNSKNYEIPSKLSETAPKKKYQSPKLSHFGSVTQLTNSFASNCMADDGTCTSSPGSNMGPMIA